MSEPLRIGLAAEGPGDYIVIEAVLRTVLTQDFVLTSLQPESSVSFGLRGGGWTGVYRWCHETRGLGGGQFSGDDTLFSNFDLVIVHVDADVAGLDYSSGSLVPRATDAALPCDQPCPPASDATDALRGVILSWMGEATLPAQVVLCTPSKSMDTWILASLFPADPAITAIHALECRLDAKTRLGQQPSKTRVRSPTDLRRRQPELVSALPSIRSTLTEANRFCSELQAATA